MTACSWSGICISTQWGFLWWFLQSKHQCGGSASFHTWEMGSHCHLTGRHGSFDLPPRHKTKITGQSVVALAVGWTMLQFPQSPPSQCFLLWDARSPRERSFGLELEGFLVSAKPAFSFNLALFTEKLKGWGGGWKEQHCLHLLHKTNKQRKKHLSCWSH